MAGMQLLFAITVFVAAMLLFIVEPMFARMVLPLLGGAPGVWNTAMVFYQGALLAGYGAAHLAATRLSLRRQALAQIVLVAAPLCVLPLGVASGWTPPVDRNPIPWLLLVMTATVGLPFFALATISPLLQRWFASCSTRNPYWLYAASNAGSLIGLVAYPVLIEPWLGLRAQSLWWKAAYGALVLLVTACALAVWRRGGTGRNEGAEAEDSFGVVAGDAVENISWKRRLRWVVLAFAPASLMLSVTTHLSMEVASMPLLWVVPLAIYLVTFVLVFAQRQRVPHAWMVGALPWVMAPLTVIYGMRFVSHFSLVSGWNLLALFVGAMVCHGELAADRPSVKRLTEFYWWMSVGGMLGGVFNALLAPVLFRWVMEYPVSLALVCMLAPGERRARWSDVVWAMAIGGSGWMLGELVRLVPTETAAYAILFKLAVPVVVVMLFRREPVRFGLAVVALFMAATWLPSEYDRTLLTRRSFFGVYHVRVDVGAQFHRFEHGTTVHGIQSLDAVGRRVPLGYYSPAGPVGQAFGALRRDGRRLANVGAVGLGAGAVAAYAAPGETWKFFEIDPLVEKIACDPRFFTYCGECRGDVKVVLGDARLSLQRSTEQFDVLLLDAYSSDAIPLHLLTREAVQLYLARLKRDGWLVFHFSNRHLDLKPVITALANDAGLACRIQEEDSVSAERKARGVFVSSWAVMCRDEAYLGRLRLDMRWQRPDQATQTTNRNMRVWTDDYASILSVWK
jgi:hypothetical protein